MKPIQVDFKPSAVFIGLFAFTSLSACLILAFMPLAWSIKLGFILLIVSLSTYAILYHGLLWLPTSIVGLRINIKNELQLLRKDGLNIPATVAENTVVTPYLIVLNYHLQKSTWRQRLFNRGIIVLPDHADAESLRQLRVWLRWSAVKQQAL